MDEPTASLDFGNQALVLRAIRALAADGYGSVLATHAPDHAFACATRVALLHHGTLLAHGPPGAILTPARLETVYGIKVAVERLASGHLVCAPDLGPAAPAAGPSRPGVSSGRSCHGRPRAPGQPDFRDLAECFPAFACRCQKYARIQRRKHSQVLNCLRRADRMGIHLVV
jgi:hypothetical protein